MTSGRASFLFHDYETFGTRPAIDRACQFAAVRTDIGLRETGKPVTIYCHPGEERLPQPEACLVTGITPQKAQREGLSEADFTGAIHELMSAPLTCITGYNNFRFDDEFTRNLRYRNLYDPYAHEWQNGNSRFDLIDITRMFSALRPGGIQWPEHEDGAPSFRLEHLAAANGINTGRAHDALADVRASIALARLLRQNCPKLWQWALALRDRHKVEQLLAQHQILLHSSSRYPAARHCITLVTPLARHPQYATQYIVYDLMVDPRIFRDLPVGELEDLLYTSAADLPQDRQRLPVKTIKINRCPMLAPVNTLPEDYRQRLDLDPDTARVNIERLGADQALIQRITALFQRPPFEAAADPDRMLYQGFFSDHDRALLNSLRERHVADWPQPLPPHADERIPEMLWRYRARNYPDTLDAAARQRWREHCRACLRDPDHLPIGGYPKLLETLREGGGDPVILDRLLAWAQQLAERHELDMDGTRA